MVDFKYRPDVDGLRMIAVVSVLLYHGGIGFPGGFIGVDVFFVISGFLITGLILKEQRTDSFRLSHFWIRRVRRILPASTFVVALTLLVGYFVLLPGDYQELAKSTIAQQLAASNMFFWSHTGYFDGPTDQMPLLHTWSLAVEEQFYLGYPFLLVLLGRYSKKLGVFLLISVGTLSFAVSEWGIHSDARSAFFCLPSRAWELLLGGFICFAPTCSRLSAWVSNALGLFGIIAIIAAAFCFDSSTRFPGIAALLPCAAAAVVIYVNSPRLTWIGKALALRPIVFIGLLSYPLYLWHWPLLCLLRHIYCGTPPGKLSRIAVLCTSFLLAALTVKYIESPIRKKQVFAKTKGLLIASFGSMTLLLTCSLLILSFDGLPTRFDPRASSYASAKNSIPHVQNVTTDRVKVGEVPAFGTPDGSWKCLVWGDSHAQVLIPGIDAACKTHRTKGLQTTHSSTPPILNFVVKGAYGLNERTPEFSRAVVDYSVLQKVDLIILAGEWSKYSAHVDFEERLSSTIKELLDAGIHVAIVRDVAKQKGDVPLMLSMAVRLGRSVEVIGISPDEYRIQNERCNSIFDQFRSKGVIVVDPAPFFVDEANLWRAEIGGVSMYSDKEHLSIEGGLRLTPLFEQLFDSFRFRE
jgi:peptidoglycan/LPS O-acetylase OafA/YrhL